MAEAKELRVELCSGPNDGEVYEIPGDRFTVGSSDECDVTLARDTAAPKSATFSFMIDGDQFSLSADAPFERGGSETSGITGGTLPMVVRVGSTDLYLSAVSRAEGATGAGDDVLKSADEMGLDLGGSAPQSSEGVGIPCERCGRVNPPGSTWCDRCGRDLSA